MGITATMATLMTAFVVARFDSRSVLRRDMLNWDDWIVLLAGVHTSHHPLPHESYMRSLKRI